jgi:hypothetical protein
MRHHAAAMNRTEDLNVKVCENFLPCVRSGPGCKSVMNASMATTFCAFTRATIIHCNGVCRIDCHPGPIPVQSLRSAQFPGRLRRFQIECRQVNLRSDAGAAAVVPVVCRPGARRHTSSTAVCGVARCPPARMGPCQPDQAEARITRQKFSGWNEGSLSASTSALTVPKVVSGLCRIPS